MKLKFKNFIYLLNDFTGILLNKDKIDHEKTIKNLKILIAIFSFFLLISVMFNVILLYE